ncbi:50S ribosomal protein L5, partial [Candidatus Woesebacteria bacterium]|nr:50S ribosomal protein L5 [Candidatus Woesebacteria bacterium]
MSKLKEKYEKEVKDRVADEFKIKNKLAVPRVEKVVVNMGIGNARDKAKTDQLKTDLAAITGQRPSIRPARISVAGFNVREGQIVGLKVTLRGRRMYDFLTRLFSVVLPRLRDFRGVKTESFDKNGNYT